MAIYYEYGCSLSLAPVNSTCEGRMQSSPVGAPFGGQIPGVLRFARLGLRVIGSSLALLS